MSDRKMTLPGLTTRKAAGEKLAMLTCYDALFAKLLASAGVDLLLVGDSVNEVFAGRSSTLSATLDQMIYHAASVRRGAPEVMIVVDLPFLSYQVSIEEAIRNAGRVLAETECQAVKLEGGSAMIGTVKALVERGIPVIGHLGFTPQSVQAIGGARVQGRTTPDAERLLADAMLLEAAGASAIVLELLPTSLAGKISRSLRIPTIGIGAGPECDGQVLVLQDMLGMNEGFSPRFLRKFAELGPQIRAAAACYVKDVHAGTYPDAEHGYE